MFGNVDPKEKVIVPVWKASTSSKEMAGPNGLAPSAGWPALGRPAIASASSDPLVASFPSPLFSSRSLTAEVTCRAEAASRSLRHPVGGTAPLHQRVALVCRASAQDRGNESSSDDKGVRTGCLLFLENPGPAHLDIKAGSERPVYEAIHLSTTIVVALSHMSNMTHADAPSLLSS